MKTPFHIFRKRHALLLLAVTVTLLVRLLYGLVVFEHIADRYSWRQDDEYSDIAYTVITAGKYAVAETSPPTMTRLPAYPLVLAGIYAVFSRSFVAVRIIQSLFCAITCVLIYFTAREATNERVAGLAAFLFAFYPNSILYCARTLSETTYCLFLSIFCFTLVRLFKSPGVWRSVATGLSFGIMMLTKSTTVLLPLFLFLTLLSAYYRKIQWHVIHSIMLFIFVASLVMAPWVIRSYRITDKLIVLSTRGGMSLYQGYYFATHLSSQRSRSQLDHEALLEATRLVRERYTSTGKPIDEYYQDRIAYSLVWEKILARPFYSSGIFLQNLFLTWFLNYGRLTMIVSFFVHIPLLLLAAYAIFVMLRRDDRVWIKMLPLIIVCAYFNLLHCVLYPHVRFMSPVIGTIVTILAAYSILHVISLAKLLRVRLSRRPF
jgi:4-amino-4-deoxy-L-arabinose transferase-like glycosyltransferase